MLLNKFTLTLLQQMEFEDSAEFEAKVLEWAKPQSDPLEALCIANVEQLALDEEETLKFTYSE